MSVDEWDQRELCPDGTCVGVIGGDGLCKVCGRAAQNWGDERKRGMVPDAEPDAPDDDDDDGADDTAEAPRGEPPAADDTEAYEWSRRQLCPDDACVGVLGPDRKCKVCGRSAV